MARHGAPSILAFDRSRSSNFFRIWLGTFPLALAAVAIVFGRLRRSRLAALRIASWVLLALPLLAMESEAKASSPQ